MIGLYHAHILSPVGWLTLSATMSGLCSVKFGKLGSESGSSQFLDTAARELNEYFRGERKYFTVPLHLDGSPFQKDVWHCLKVIPYGATPSYSDIAAQIGRPSATRAVAITVAKNPLLIVLPCHRVIGKNGQLTGYVGGLSAKRDLLRLEFGVAKTRPLEHSPTLQLRAIGNNNHHIHNTSSL